MAREAAGCVMPLSGEGNRFAIYAGSIAYKNNCRADFIKRYGRNMEVSKKVFQIIRGFDDAQRTQFLRCLGDPLGVLEGKWPNKRGFVFKLGLLVKLMQKYLS